MQRNDNFYYIYPKDKNGRRTGHTICILNKPDPETQEPKSFYGISLCSENDQFEYTMGRKLAYERALEAYSNYEARKKST